MEASVQVLLDSGMSTPALREVRQQQFSVRGLADVKLSRCWLALAVWLFHFLLYGCSDALLGGMNGILMGSTVVLWCSAERDDKAFLGSLSAKIVTLAFATCYAISYGFKLKELADVQKACGVSGRERALWNLSLRAFSSNVLHTSQSVQASSRAPDCCPMLPR